MGYRKNRETPTKPRRIHATDLEWSKIKHKAETAELSVSAYMVSRVLAPKGPVDDRSQFRTVQLLTSIHALLVEIADHTACDENDLISARVILRLQTISERLDEFSIETLPHCQNETGG
ncbi:hypothetical protein [uncultured Pelagimonas sp.]|uniref:plasmid mobilization protein n=1 Tax=uncultured Pelagimonas sp. TaxID=1618102 RepID=UPI00261A2F84|nr:hypothetical protein [uncultured Pelagimonas sp.]